MGKQAYKGNDALVFAAAEQDGVHFAPEEVEVAEGLDEGFEVCEGAGVGRGEEGPGLVQAGDGGGEERGGELVHCGVVLEEAGMCGDVD